MSSGMMNMGQPATSQPPAGWNEQGYLAANPDVAAAVQSGQVPSGWVHYETHGKAEGRPGGLGGTAAPGGPPSLLTGPGEAGAQPGPGVSPYRAAAWNSTQAMNNMPFVLDPTKMGLDQSKNAAAIFPGSAQAKRYNAPAVPGMLSTPAAPAPAPSNPLLAQDPNAMAMLNALLSGQPQGGL